LTTARITSRAVGRSPISVPSNMLAVPTKTSTGSNSSSRRPSTNGNLTSDCQTRATLRRRRCCSLAALTSSAEEGGSTLASACAGRPIVCGTRASNSASGRRIRRNISHSAANAQPNTSASFQAMSINWL